MKVNLKKLKELPDALHPNNIIVGYEIEGEFISEPKIGECFYVGHFWATSTVKEIIDEQTFKTCNSIYRWLPVNIE
jgi:hypothetical protein